MTVALGTAEDSSGREVRPPPPVQRSLQNRAISAGLWSIGGYGVSQTIRFGSNLVMTRLLVPEMFGVMAIATVVMVGLAMFSDLGLRQSVIQNRRGADPAFLNTAWTVQILRGVLLCGMTLLIALGLHAANRIGIVPLTSVYADPSLPLVIAALAATPLINGFTATKAFEANRNLALKRLTLVGLIAQIAGLVCMIIWAWLDASIWALVAGGLVGSTFAVFLGHLLLPGVPNRLLWDRGVVAELVHFGKWIFLSSILGFLAANLDRLILGGLLDAGVMGVFAIAYLIYSSVDQLIAHVVGQVAFPALSEVVRGGGQFKAAYYRLHAVIAPVAYFLAGLLAVSGCALVGWLYDPRYADAGWMLQILAIGILATPTNVAIQGYLALGRPRVLPLITAFRIIVLVTTVPLAYLALGLTGALWAIVASQLVGIPIVLIMNARQGLLAVRKEILLLPALSVGLITGFLVDSVLR